MPVQRLSLEQRLARVEAQLAIQQLPIRYAQAVDGRDLDGLVDLFVEDVDCGRWGKGRSALNAFYRSADVLQGFYRSIHYICGHTVDLIDDNKATGRVYCRAEHEDGDSWVVMAICYFDHYQRLDDQWFFSRRDERHWYSTDWLERPGKPQFQHWPGRYTTEKYQPRLPDSFSEWNKFWSEVDSDVIRKLTAHR